MTTSLAHKTSQRTAPLDQVIADITAMGVRVSTYTMPASHSFDDCLWCNELERPAVATVYPRDESCTDCCVQCLAFVTDKAITDSFGRSDYCSVEIAVVEVPAPVAVVVPAPRDHDLAALLPIACDVCPDARRSVAAFELAFDVIHNGETEGIRWHLCGDCLPSCMVAASTQNRGFTPPILTVLPTREAVAA